MDTKKTITYALIGFIISGVFFGTILYFTKFRQPGTTVVDYKTYEYNVGEFSTNLGETKRYFKTAIIVETTDKELIKKMEEKNAQLRDQIISTLISKDAEELLKSEGQQQLKQELIDGISKVVNSDRISNLYFIDYIIQ